MQVRTYRARSLKEALQLVQQELGPEARILQTRELQTGWWERFAHGRQFEIRTRRPGPQPLPLRRRSRATGDEFEDHSAELQGLDAIMERGRHLSHPVPQGNPGEEASLLTHDERPEESATPSDAAVWFETLTELIEAEVPESAARELVDALRSEWNDPAPTPMAQRQALMERLSVDVTTCGPIRVTAGQRRTVALVGPTGVGKTTTIAKLAANLRLRDHLRVGLLTVDTYRVAAVEQLRTYAEIMDLPMEVVSTPREMNAAVARMADQDIVLIDTAGHSPRDAVQLQRLKSMLAEAQPDEIHVVMSAVSATAHLHQIVHRFAPLGATAVVVTKLDEATGLGNLLPVLQASRLPISYLTCGQSVPDDIVVAEQSSLLPVLLGQQAIAALI